MHGIRMLSLMGLLVLALTSSANAAFYLGPTTVTESTGNTCSGSSAEGSGSCPVKWSTNDFEINGPMGMAASCALEIEGDIQGVTAAFTYSVSACQPKANLAAPCTGNGDRHPSFNGPSPALYNNGGWPLEFDICFSVLGQTVRCHTFAVLEETATHNYQLSIRHGAGCENNTSYSVNGQLTQSIDAAHPGIEIKDSAPPSAFSEATTEASGIHCSQTAETLGGLPEVEGGCPVLFEGLQLTLKNIGVTHICDLTLEGAVNGAGNYIGSYDFHNCTSGGIQECTEQDRHLRWRLSGGASPHWDFDMQLCWIAFGLKNFCQLSGGELKESMNHTYELSFTAAPCFLSGYTLTGALIQVVDVTHPAIELK